MFRKPCNLDVDFPEMLGASLDSLVSISASCFRHPPTFSFELPASGHPVVLLAN